MKMTLKNGKAILENLTQLKKKLKGRNASWCQAIIEQFEPEEE